MTWKPADAKNRISELVNLALAEGPQVVERRNDSVVVVSKRDYDQLTGERPDFKTFLTRKGPSLDGPDLARDKSRMRKTEF